MAYRNPNRPNSFFTAADIKVYRAESADYLRKLFPVGSEVTTLVRNVTRSGMGRTISVLAIDKRQRPSDAKPASAIVNVSHHVARVLDWQYDTDRSGVYVTGCGMDMCFHTVYSLARTLYDGAGGDAGYLLDNRTI